MPAVPLRPGHVEYPGSVTGDASLGTSAGPAGRVGTSLPELVEHVAAEYRLGDVGDWSVLATGYEDCNIDLRARRARVVVKVFAAGRPAGIAERTAAIIAPSRRRASATRGCTPTPRAATCTATTGTGCW